MMELKCVLVVLLAIFDFSTVEDPWTLGYEIGFTWNVKGVPSRFA